MWNSRRKKILFLPFLQIPSGHHQVAQALMDGMTESDPEIECEVIDILSYSFGKVEGLVSKTYLQWIKCFPLLYSKIYKKNVYSNLSDHKRFRLYEVLFLHHMKSLLHEKQPDFIVCTHALPSYMLNALKEKGDLSTPVMNVYTDYFIHRFWGIQHIDYHFTPTYETKEYLKGKGIEEKQIFMTGIPIHKKILKTKKIIEGYEPLSSLSILITGGNLGVGAIEDLVAKMGDTIKIHFYILCGKNKTLYENLKKMSKNNLTPVGYVKCRDVMNQLYDKIDAIITKPGGVTVSESLFKGKPIFIYHALPGQEEINLNILEKLGLVIHLKGWKKQDKTIEDHLLSFFQDKLQVERYQRKLKEYHDQITKKEPSDIIREIINK